MAWESAQRIEWAVDMAAAATFAAGVGFAFTATAGGSAPILAVAAAMAAASMAAWAGLRRVAVEEPIYVLPDFRLSLIEASEPSDAADELLLDDALVGLEPGARVVQMFGPRRPRAIDHRGRSAPPDASEALSDALEQLRRSLQ